ncbi:MAG: hypothetical protein DMF97_21960, partial [Acidobacteria bacterium]
MVREAVHHLFFEPLHPARLPDGRQRIACLLPGFADRVGHLLLRLALGSTHHATLCGSLVVATGAAGDLSLHV